MSLQVSHLEGEGSSCPKRDMMLINVLIPEKKKKIHRVEGLGTMAKNKKRKKEVARNKRTFFSHVHVVDLPVPIFRLTDTTVGQRVASVIRIHAKVEVVAGVSHRKLKENH